MELEIIMEKFRWGHKGDERRVHRIRWDKFCASKFHGGMNFQDLKSFILALLAKQG